MIQAGDILDGKYEVVRRLGHGGFGEVFLAADTTVVDRRVAIKVLSNPAASDRDDLVWEMQALARLDHPSVVTFYHHFTQDDRLFLVMEYCGGGSMHDRLFGGAICSQEDVFAWGLTLCRTLQNVHDKGIFHHDIKPSNILFLADGQVKVGDFGVANRRAGTRLYMPPELLLGEARTPNDPRVDIYALGLTLLEALEGRSPFEELDFDEAVQARMAHDFVGGDLPRWAQEVLLKATHPATELRFQSMMEFAEAIEGNRVVYAFDADRLKAHQLAEKAKRALARIKWKSAERLVDRALMLSPDTVSALLVAGQCQLLLRRPERARDYFMRALTLSPRTQVQKELGWLSLESHRIPEAISFLTDHLQRNAADYEAYNLLLKCYIEAGRYDAGAELALALIGQDSRNECFRNNLFVCRMLDDFYSEQDLLDLDIDRTTNPFMIYNITVARERPPAWHSGGLPHLKSKLVFQEYRFGRSGPNAKRNVVAVETEPGERVEWFEPIVTIGHLPSNDVVLPDNTVSRRHCLIINYPDDVWLHDLGSTRGTIVDGQEVRDSMFLDGLHEVQVGPKARLSVAANVERLV